MYGGSVRSTGHPAVLPALRRRNVGLTQIALKSFVLIHFSASGSCSKNACRKPTLGKRRICRMSPAWSRAAIKQEACGDGCGCIHYQERIKTSLIYPLASKQFLRRAHPHVVKIQLGGGPLLIQHHRVLNPSTLVTLIFATHFADWRRDAVEEIIE